jgi:hypothetical protein
MNVVSCTGRLSPRRLACLLLAAAALLVSSCGRKGRKPVFPVSGTVLVNGKAAPEAIVYFHPVADDPPPVLPYGQVNESGGFTLSTYESGDGAPAGDYIVTIEWRERSGLTGKNFEGPDRLQGRYSDPKKSKLRVTIKEETNSLSAFQLKN